MRVKFCHFLYRGSISVNFIEGEILVFYFLAIFCIGGHILAMFCKGGADFGHFLYRG